MGKYKFFVLHFICDKALILKIINDFSIFLYNYNVLSILRVYFRPKEAFTHSKAASLK